MPYRPQSPLGELLAVIVQEIASHSPNAFAKVDVGAAIQEADELVDQYVHETKTKRHTC